MDYVIGIDFGTLSARAVIFSCVDGSEHGEGVSNYTHGVITETLPDGTPLDSDYALQCPQDIRQSLKEAVTQALLCEKISPKDIIGIGIDATTYSQLACNENGVPLCETEEFKSEPMAWIKLWKHLGAQKVSEKIKRYHERTGRIIQCKRYGGVFNCEWALPKLLETYEKAKPLFLATKKFCDLGDWVAWLLTGNPVASLHSYGFKCMWSDDLGFPKSDALDEISGDFGKELYKRLLPSPCGYEKPCGHLTKSAAEWLGLAEGTAVACPMGDGNTPGVSICAKYKNSMAITYGTSVAMSFMSKKLCEIKGINGVVKDCYYPGFYAYDAGQPCAGDMLAWFSRDFVNEDLKKAAGNLPIQSYLSNLAEKAEPYKNTLTVLDWFSGNRSILNDSSRRGVIAGLGINTKTYEIYCAMIQGICCGSRKAIDYFAENGLEFENLIVFGGMADKNRFFLNQLASIVGRPVLYSKGHKITSLGCAILGAVAAGKDFNSVLDAMCPNDFEQILPDLEHKTDYEAIYSRWCNLHDRLFDFNFQS